MTVTNNKITILILLILGIFWRLYNIEFGLPHSFHAGEPRVTEFAINYTYEIRDIVGNNNWYKLIPVTYVYGTFPTYLLTIATMVYSKTNGLLGITFEKMHLIIFMRVLSAFLSLFIVGAIAFLYKKIFKDNFGTLLTFFLLALNWKLIVHVHYVNMDIFLTILMSLAYLTTYKYFKSDRKTLYTILMGVLFGLAVGSKFTALITLPLFLLVYLKKKDFRGMFAFGFIVYGVFAVTNPYSIIYATNFALRIHTMLFKEAGIVFDSVDPDPLKYVYATLFLSTLPVFLSALYGKTTAYKESKDKTFHIFLIGHFVIYLLFYSLQSRRVDRWMLPVLPIILLYGAYGISRLRSILDKKMSYFSFAVVVGFYLFFPILLLFQFRKDTPKSAAYLWLKDNVSTSSNKLSYTEEGLDPINKLEGARVIKSEVYEGEGAFLFMPEDPEGYDYVIISSRPMENFKRPEVIRKYPFYYAKWHNFETTLHDESKFELIKSFELPKPDLIQLSDVYVYKNLNYVDISRNENAVPKDSL